MLSHYEALTRIKAAKLVAILRHVPPKKSAIRWKNTATACSSAAERR